MLPSFQLGSVTFYTFGLVFGCAICMGWFCFDRFFQRQGLPVNMPVVGTLMMVSGFLGAKLDSWWLAGSHQPGLENLSGGYTYLGCVLAGWLAGAIYVWVRRLPVLRCFDALFCIGPAYAVGRIGCFLAGDGDYGVPSKLPWAVSFPHGLVPTTARVHPTMLYCTLWETAVFVVLWKLSDPKRRLRPGTLLGCYLVATSVGRFAIECLSLNPVIAFGLTEAQLVSVALATGGAALLLWIYRPAKNSTLNVLQIDSSPIR